MGFKLSSSEMEMGVLFGALGLLFQSVIVFFHFRRLCAFVGVVMMAVIQR